MPDGRSIEVVAGVERLDPAVGPVLVAVGVFDGLHRGHGYLLRSLVREAHARRARAAVITFDAHPDQIVRGEAPPLLLDPDERLVRLAAAGVEVVVIAHFDEILRRTPYDAFVRSLAERVELTGFVMTPDAAFGHERRGTPDALSLLAASSKPTFDIVVVPPYLLDGRPVRSSEIRADVAAGRLADARRLLGRRHAVTGLVDAAGGVTFPLPVALPPPGSYRASVGEPWSLDGRAPRGRTATVSVEPVGAGSLSLRRPVGQGRRVRIAFGRAEEAPIARSEERLLPSAG
jgi:riboflavin kinase / FMN adenylyltransferase